MAKAQMEGFISDTAQQAADRWAAGVGWRLCLRRSGEHAASGYALHSWVHSLPWEARQHTAYPAVWSASIPIRTAAVLPPPDS